MSTVLPPPILGFSPSPPPTPHRWTCDEFHRLAEQGWFENQYVMLIDGEILEMPVQNPPHAMAYSLTEDVLRSALGPGFYVRGQLPLLLGLMTDPIPDLAIVPGSPRDYAQHPTTALLIVEISDSTLAYDRTDKASLYAAANIADYWVINLVQRQVHVYRDPGRDKKQRFGWSYGQELIFSMGQTVSPLLKPQVQVAVADLMP